MWLKILETAGKVYKEILCTDVLSEGMGISIVQEVSMKFQWGVLTSGPLSNRRL